MTRPSTPRLGKGDRGASKELGVQGQYLESQQQTDYAKNITEFLQQKYNMIVTVGFLLGEDTQKFAKQNPNVPFAIVDFGYDPGHPQRLGPDLLPPTRPPSWRAIWPPA